MRILGEDLVLFRDRKGRAGLLYPRCMHRGTSLYYGRVEQDGIRCCYHGWLFDVEGHCLDQPCEPDQAGIAIPRASPGTPCRSATDWSSPTSGRRKSARVLPAYDNLESAGTAGRPCGARYGGFGATGDDSLPVVPYSWLHMNDNVMDPFHVQVLHSTFSTVQFVPQFAVMPQVDFFATEAGVCYSAVRQLPDGREVERISSWLLPNIMSVPDVTLKAGPSTASPGWCRSMTRTTSRPWSRRVPKDAPFRSMLFNGKTWGQMSEAEHRNTPGDYEAQAGQGPITLHSDEHLVTSDRGIMMLRRMLLEQMEVVAAGGDPTGVSL